MIENFFDLNVLYTQENLVELLKREIVCGYNVVCVAKTIDLSDFSPSKRKKVKGSDKLSKPSLNPLELSHLSTIGEIKSLKIFIRLNIIFENPKDINSFYREYTKELMQFDLIALQPKNFESMLKCFEDVPFFDVVTINIEDIGTNYLKSNHFKILKAKGFYLEFEYSHLWKNTGKSNDVHRENFVTILTKLSSRCRNSLANYIILSSGTSSPWCIRRSLSLNCLMKSFGLQPYERIVNTLSKNPESALYRGIQRRFSASGAGAIMRLSMKKNVRIFKVKKLEEKNQKGEMEVD